MNGAKEYTFPSARNGIPVCSHSLVAQDRGTHPDGNLAGAGSNRSRFPRYRHPLAHLETYARYRKMVGTERSGL